MNRLTDQQLLRDYAERRSEAAFAELVRRHVDIIYSAALRMVYDSHLLSDQDWISYKDRWRTFGEEAALRWMVSKYSQK